jgi:charged multivesicular body protein 5
MIQVSMPCFQNAIQQRALRTLKQKKMYEAQLAQLTQQVFNMESAALATDNLRNTMATVKAMQDANKEIKRQYGKVDIDKIEVGKTNAFSEAMLMGIIEHAL